MPACPTDHHEVVGKMYLYVFTRFPPTPSKSITRFVLRFPNLHIFPLINLLCLYLYQLRSLVLHSMRFQSELSYRICFRARASQSMFWQEWEGAFVSYVLETRYVYTKTFDGATSTRLSTQHQTSESYSDVPLVRTHVAQ